MTGAPTVSVVVVNWNSGGYLRDMLASLWRHGPSVPFEVVVVDNGSTDGSADVGGPDAGSGPACVRVVRNSRNRGLAAANNQGMAATTGAYILIANPDVELTAGAVDTLMAAMERHPAAAFVVPRLEHPDGSPQTSAGDLPRLGEALVGRRLSGLVGRSREAVTAGYWWDGWDHAEEREIGRGAEACYLVRRAAVEEIGGQDERFPLDWEGIEWNARARRAGWQVWLAPEAKVRHTGGVSISGAPIRWIVAGHLGMYRYFAPRVPAAARPLLAAAVGGRAVAKLLVGVAGVPLYRWAHRRPSGPRGGGS